ncbi:ECF-type sigma factor [Isoptericola jiangsuensis]|uniref:ECF-type sigma factor n=1 Tax=Bacteria TaxID=2 RepID=UPI000D5427E1|nr:MULTISPECIES: ECF-type sigma factor [Stenotrophomonas]AWH48631.1 RNA polymerase subunit sigma-24 [Stenotrophomonas sp. SAU14A_NAIMI4_5]MBK0011324.1 RNA polymerase subunit sigma-24 [Stenotrophomonas sp. S41]
MTVSGSPADDGVTTLLKRWSTGNDLSARDRLLQMLYAQLRGMAAVRLSGDSPGLLQPTMLVNEALMRMLDPGTAYNDRVHFLALAALKMRSVMVDHARAMGAAKRGGDQLHLTLEHADREGVDDQDAVDVLALDAALLALADVDARASSTVEWMYFGGMRREEIAAAQGVSVPTVDRDLRFAKAWLKRHLGGMPSRDDGA